MKSEKKEVVATPKKKGAKLEKGKGQSAASLQNFSHKENDGCDDESCYTVNKKRSKSLLSLAPVKPS